MKIPVSDIIWKCSGNVLILLIAQIILSIKKVSTNTVVTRSVPGKLINFLPASESKQRCYLTLLSHIGGWYELIRSKIPRIQNENINKVFLEGNRKRSINYSIERDDVDKSQVKRTFHDQSSSEMIGNQSICESAGRIRNSIIFIWLRMDR